MNSKKKVRKQLVPKKANQTNKEKGKREIKIKQKKLKINKTHSLDNTSNKLKKPTIDKISKPQKIFNNSMEELDYLNFSRINLDYYKKNSSLEEDIFNPENYCDNKKENNKIVQIRYNKIDTSNDTIKSKNNKSGSDTDFLDSNKNIILETPSTICNYYEKSENYSEEKNINIKKNNYYFNKNLEYKKLGNKSIQIPSYYFNNNLNNHPIYSNRLKCSENDYSSSNIKRTQNDYSQTKNYFYNPKANSAFNKIKGFSKEKKKEDISSSMLKKRNANNTNYLFFHKIKNKNNLRQNYINYIENNKNNLNKKKSLSTQNAQKSINSKIKNKNSDNGFSNSNMTYNIDTYNYIEKRENLSNRLKPIKKDIKNNITKKSINSCKNRSLNQQKIKQKNNCSNVQRPIKLCFNKTQFNSYFITPTTSNSDKKENQTNSINKDIEKDYLFLNVNNNNITDDRTRRNNKDYFKNMRKDIIVKRKKLNKTNNNINYCDKSNTSNVNINSTFTNYQNDKPVIKVNLKKPMKSSSEFIQFINVDIKNKNEKNKKKNDSSVNTCGQGSMYTSPIIKESLSKRKILKSPLQVNHMDLKTSKTLKDNSKFIKKIKANSQYNKNYKNDISNIIDKKYHKDSNKKNYYYELNNKNNNSNININRSKNLIKPKTQSDKKFKKKIKKEENSKKVYYDNKENKDNNIGYGMDKRVKKKLLDKMNKTTNNNLDYIWGGYLLAKRNMQGPVGVTMNSTYKDDLFNNKLCCNKIIQNENSKNEEKDFEQKINEKRNQKELIVIKEYKASKFSNTFV